MSGPANPQRVLLSYVLPDGTKGQVQLDAAVSEQHTTTAQVTDHPVETGPNISDHIRVLPKRLSISGIVTNTPIYVPATQMRGISGKPGSVSATAGNQTVKFQVLKFDDEFDRVRDVYGELVDATAAGALFSVTTTLANYENMAITSLSAPRSAGSGNALTFQIDMQELRIVETQTVAAPPSKRQEQKRRGNKPTRDATSKEQAAAQEDIDPINKIIGLGG